MVWGGIGRLTALTLSPRNWIAAKSLKIPSGQVRLFRRKLSSSSSEPRSFGAPKSLAELYAFDGIPPKSFTLVYKANVGNYFVSTQVFLWLTITACGVALIVSAIESYTGTAEDETLVKERNEARRKEVEARRIVQKALIEDKSTVGVNNEPSSDNDTIIMSKPNMADLVEKDLSVFSVFVICLVGITAATTKLLRTVPVRVYVGKKGLCVGAYYGSLIPGRIIRKEFVRGTVTTFKGQKVTGDSDIDGCVYRTGSGDVIVLFDQFFRTPADFNYILKAGQSKQEKYDPTNPNKASTEDLLSQDILSAFEADDPRRKNKNSSGQK